jgi:hypothetical protein
VLRLRPKTDPSDGHAGIYFRMTEKQIVNVELTRARTELAKCATRCTFRTCRRRHALSPAPCTHVASLAIRASVIVAHPLKRPPAASSREGDSLSARASSRDRRDREAADQRRRAVDLGGEHISTIVEISPESALLRLCGSFFFCCRCCGRYGDRALPRSVQHVNRCS